MNSATLAEAVKTLITPLVTAHGGTVERTYVPRAALEEVESLTVWVVPKKRVGERYTRSAWKRDVTIDVAVYAPCPDDATADTLSEFTEDLAAFLEQNLPSPGVSVGLLAVNIEPIFDWKEMDEKKLFVSLAEAIYRWGAP